MSVPRALRVWLEAAELTDRNSISPLTGTNLGDTYFPFAEFPVQMTCSFEREDLSYKKDLVILWLLKSKLQKSTEPYYKWNKQKRHEGTHCLLQIHEVRTGVIFQQIGSHSLPSKVLAPQGPEFQMPSNIACKYKLGIVEMQEIFSHRSQESSSVKLWRTQSSVV